MHRTFLCYVLLLFIIAYVQAKLSSLQRVCEKNKNLINQLNLDYDEVAATVNVSLLTKNDKLFTSYKIYLFADWNQSTDTISCQDDSHLLSHTVYDITVCTENVSYTLKCLHFLLPTYFH